MWNVSWRVVHCGRTCSGFVGRGEDWVGVKSDGNGQFMLDLVCKIQRGFLFWRVSACRGSDADILAEGVWRCHHLYNKSYFHIKNKVIKLACTCKKKNPKTSSSSKEFSVPSFLIYSRYRSLPLFDPVSEGIVKCNLFFYNDFHVYGFNTPILCKPSFLK